MQDLLLIVTNELSAFLSAADKREHLVQRCELYFDRLVEPLDIPGPDPIIDPVLRSTIRPLVTRLYDEAVRKLEAQQHAA